LNADVELPYVLYVIDDVEYIFVIVWDVAVPDGIVMVPVNVLVAIGLVVVAQFPYKIGVHVPEPVFDPTI
jgi:hypothetical protein